MAGSRLTASLSTSSQLTAPQACSGSCLLTCQHSNNCYRHWTSSCQQRPNKHARVQRRASRFMNFRQLSSYLPVAKSRAQTACPMSSSPSSGRCWAQSCWHSCKIPFKLRPLLAKLHYSRGPHLAVQGQGLQGHVGQLPPFLILFITALLPVSTATSSCWPNVWLPALGLPFSMWWTPLRPLLCLVGGLATMCCACV